MAASKKRGLQYESVEAVCELLVADGYLPDKISVRDILAKTATGSLTTIRVHRDRWLSQRRRASVVPRSNGTASNGASSTGADPHLWSDSATLAALAAINRLQIDLKRALESIRKLRARNASILPQVDEVEQLVLSVSLRVDQLIAAQYPSPPKRGPEFVDRRPLQRIPPEPTGPVRPYRIMTRVTGAAR